MEESHLNYSGRHLHFHPDLDDESQPKQFLGFIFHGCDFGILMGLHENPGMPNNSLIT